MPTLKITEDLRVVMWCLVIDFLKWFDSEKDYANSYQEVEHFLTKNRTLTFEKHFPP